MASVGVSEAEALARSCEEIAQLRVELEEARFSKLGRLPAHRGKTDAEMMELSNQGHQRVIEKTQAGLAAAAAKEGGTGACTINRPLLTMHD